MVASPNTSSMVFIRENNKVKVSELNNPMNFPSLNTYQVGNGFLLTMSTNTMNISEWNYGQYPLYVFTSQGLWNLNVGDGTAVYSTVSTPTYNDVPITSVNMCYSCGCCLCH